MNREPIFDAFRDILKRGFSASEVRKIDAAIDEAIDTATGVKPEHSVSQAGKDLIKSFEGCKLKAYPDPATGGDPWTIGWGSTGPGIKKGVEWTQAMADSRFAEHVDEFAASVAAILEGAPTSQSQFDAMVSMAYNVGVRNFASSTLLKKHKAGDFKGAAAEFARWNKAADKVMAGLTRRRAAEAALYRSGGGTGNGPPKP